MKISNLFKLQGKVSKSAYDQSLENFLSAYPTSATCWSQADDRIRDLARYVRNAYNEFVIDVVEGDKGYLESLDFRSFKTPAAWNSESQKFIRQVWAVLPDNVRCSVITAIID